MATIIMRIRLKPAAASAALAFLLLLLLDLTWPGHGAWLLVVGIPLALLAAALFWRDRMAAQQHFAALEAAPFAQVGVYGLSSPSAQPTPRAADGIPLALLLAAIAALAILLFIGGAVGSAEPTEPEPAATLQQDVTAIDRSRDGEPDAAQLTPQPLQTSGAATPAAAASVSPPANTQPTGGQPSGTAAVASSSASSNGTVRPIVVAAPKPAAAVAEEEAETVALPQSALTFEYTVAEGDTLYEIALEYGSTVDELMELNQLDSHSYIHPGDVLLIPHPEEDGDDS